MEGSNVKPELVRLTLILVKNGLPSDDLMSMSEEKVPAVIIIELSLLNVKYRVSAVKVTMGAELPAIEDAARIDFLVLGVMMPIISLIGTFPADLGVGRDGN